MSGRATGGLRAAVLVSTIAHTGLILGLWLLGTRNPAVPPMRVYAVNIVSPPPQEAGPPRPARAEVAEPEPEPADEPEPEPPPPPPPPPPPAPPERQTQPPAAPPPPPETPAPAPRPAPPPAAAPREGQTARGDDPDPSSPGGDNLNVRLPGVECPTPDYCNNIVRQIDRYFRSPSSGEAEVYFVINRDGSISELRLLGSTGNASFRVAVLEAVEQAGRNQAFGPLPDAYQADRLPVSFFFRPDR